MAFSFFLLSSIYFINMQKILIKRLKEAKTSLIWRRKRKSWRSGVPPSRWNLTRPSRNFFAKTSKCLLPSSLQPLLLCCSFSISLLSCLVVAWHCLIVEDLQLQQQQQLLPQFESNCKQTNNKQIMCIVCTLDSLWQTFCICFKKQTSSVAY